MNYLNDFEKNEVYRRMKDLVPGDRFPGKPWSLRVIRTIKGGFNPVILCRDSQRNELVVTKTWMQDTPQEPRDFTFIRDILPRHPRILETIEICLGVPRDGCWTFIFPYCSGGSMYGLSERCMNEQECMPEAFLWYYIHEVLEGLQACASKGVWHGDLHPGNIFLSFPQPIQDQWPNVVLADFDNQPFGDIDFHKPLDLNWVFVSIHFWVRMAYAKAQYSQELVDLTSLISGEQDGYDASKYDAPSFEAIMEVVYPQAEKCMELCNGPKSLGVCGWMKSYFIELQANPEREPPTRGQIPRRTPPADFGPRRSFAERTDTGSSSQIPVEKPGQQMNIMDDSVNTGKPAGSLPSLTAQLIAKFQVRLSEPDPTSIGSSENTAFSDW